MRRLRLKVQSRTFDIRGTSYVHHYIVAEEKIEINEERDTKLCTALMGLRSHHLVDT